MKNNTGMSQDQEEYIPSGYVCIWSFTEDQDKMDNSSTLTVVKIAIINWEGKYQDLYTLKYTFSQVLELGGKFADLVTRNF